MAEAERVESVDETAVTDDLHLIYKIDGRPNEVDIFELSRVLTGLGEVLKEANRLLHSDSDLILKVKPFEPGSFIMDIAMYVQQNPGYRAFVAHPDFLKQAKELLEYVGLIKKAGEYGTSLLDLLRRLKNGKPDKVEKKGDTFEFTAADGGVIPVSAPVNKLYNSGVVNNFIFNIAAPAERPGVDGIATYLRDAERLTGVKITKDDVPAIKAYSEPELIEGRVEVLENTTIYMLHPKSGNYGEGSGQWTFRIAGTKRNMKAKISDQSFLANYTSGSIRFYAQDLLKARVHEKQTIEGPKVKVHNEITEVLEYRPAHPSERR